MARTFEGVPESSSYYHARGKHKHFPLHGALGVSQSILCCPLVPQTPPQGALSAASRVLQGLRGARPSRLGNFLLTSIPACQLYDASSSVGSPMTVSRNISSPGSGVLRTPPLFLTQSVVPSLQKPCTLPMWVPCPLWQNLSITPLITPAQ